MCMHRYVCSTQQGHERALDPPDKAVVSCSVCGHQEGNTGPLEEQLALLTTEHPLSSTQCIFI